MILLLVLLIATVAVAHKRQGGLEALLVGVMLGAWAFAMGMVLTLAMGPFGEGFFGDLRLPACLALFLVGATPFVAYIARRAPA